MTDILVVDDVQSEAQLMKGYLEKGGYTVVTAHSGAEALEKASQESPKVIVTDLVMPEMSGLELCRKLKKDPNTAETPIIACTTKDRQVDQKWAQKQGVMVYLVKPCTQEQMLDAVKSVLS
jgi:twitching motility two-component system response regulator PilH